MTPTPLPRGEFPVAEHVVYLNHAGVAPIPLRSAERITEWARLASERGGLASDERDARIEGVREQAAGLCGAPSSDIAFVKNTTEGLAFVASGLDWHEGDRVIVPDGEFPSTIYPWLALSDRGVVVERVPPAESGARLPVERFEEALRKGPARVVCTSWVQFGSGWRTDLAALGRLCRVHGALLCVDLIQGLGVIPADLGSWNVDFAAADAHKWLLGPEGIGIFYAAEGARELLRPLEPGWNAVAHRREWENLELAWDPTARRFEGGSHNAAGIFGLGGSLELLGDATVEDIWAHVDRLCEGLATGLPEAGGTLLSDRAGPGRSGIVTFGLRGWSPEALGAALGERGFVCAAPRGGGVRVSPHAYNTEEELGALVDAVAELRAG